LGGARKKGRRGNGNNINSITRIQAKINAAFSAKKSKLCTLLPSEGKKEKGRKRKSAKVSLLVSVRRGEKGYEEISFLALVAYCHPLRKKKKKGLLVVE